MKKASWAATQMLVEVEGIEAYLTPFKVESI